MGVMQHHRRQLKRLCSQACRVMGPLRGVCWPSHSAHFPAMVRFFAGKLGVVDYTERHARLPIRKREPQMIDWITLPSSVLRHSIADALLASRRWSIWIMTMPKSLIWACWARKCRFDLPSDCSDSTKRH